LLLFWPHTVVLQLLKPFEPFWHDASSQSTPAPLGMGSLVTATVIVGGGVWAMEMVLGGAGGADVKAIWTGFCVGGGGFVTLNVLLPHPANSEAIAAESKRRIHRLVTTSNLLRVASS
jgi:hypothetical protein